jgi:hypothetical protein
MPLEIVGFRTIANVEVLRNLDDVYIAVVGRRPSGETKKYWSRSPGNRHARLTRSQARRLAFRLIEAASKVDRKQDKYEFLDEER